MEDHQLFQGVWVLLSHEYRGEKLHEEAIRLRLARLFLVGQRYTLKWQEKVVRDDQFRIDPATSPRQFDLVHVFEDGHEWVVPGIYRLEGNLLSICLGMDRPTAFLTRPDLDRSLAVYRREDSLSLPDDRRSP